MNEPVTQLDTQHSGPDGVVTPWEQTRRVLETAELFWLATVRADGRPHVTPLVAVWHDGALYFTTDDTSQKAMNLRRNPHVILTTDSILTTDGILTTGSNPWKDGLDVVVEGDAVQVTDDSVLERVASVWATKWGGESWHYQVRNGYFYFFDEDGQTVLVGPNPVFSVKPRKVFASVKGRSQTRHQF